MLMTLVDGRQSKQYVMFVSSMLHYHLIGGLLVRRVRPGDRAVPFDICIWAGGGASVGGGRVLVEVVVVVT